MTDAEYYALEAKTESALFSFLAICQKIKLFGAIPYLLPDEATTRLAKRKFYEVYKTPFF